MPRHAAVTLAAALVTLTAATAPVRADHPRRPVDVAAVAHAVEDASRHVLYRAASWHGPQHPAEARALRSLDRLADEARHFHRQVERGYGDARHTARDFEDLADAYFAARASLPVLRSHRLQQDFRAVERPMAVLLDAFADAPRPHPGYGSGWQGRQPGYGYGEPGYGHRGRDDDRWADDRDDDGWRGRSPDGRYDGRYGDDDRGRRWKAGEEPAVEVDDATPDPDDDAGRR